VAQLEVDPAVLDETANGLRHCVEIAHEFSDHRRRLMDLASDCGSDHLRATVEHFVGSWGYGMGLTVGDADHLAKQLESAAEAYRRVEVDLSGVDR
jgi:hypothetical protein